ncbi:hypothetical protein [Streptomyces sp. NPDC002209]|uniref:hypothetical protein n=1 Tax=Streptomyces sp. NPDC002209 TaxID=3364638 RepID=UPI003681F351
MPDERWIAVFTVKSQGQEFEDTRPVAGWDDEGNALVVDRKAGRRVQASKQPGFVAVRESAGYTHSFPAPPGWTVRWCKDGADDIVDPVVAFMEDSSVGSGIPLIADLEACLIRDLHRMHKDEQRRGRQPFLMPPSDAPNQPGQS